MQKKVNFHSVKVNTSDAPEPAFWRAEPSRAF